MYIDDLSDLDFLVQVHIFDLDRMEHRGHFPQSQDGTCISALAFNALGTVLAAATAGGGLMLYQVAGRRVSPWHMSNSSTLRERLAAVPAAICELSFSPDPKVRAPVLARRATATHCFSHAAQIRRPGAPQ